MGTFRVVFACLAIIFGLLSLLLGVYGFYWALFTPEDIVTRLRLGLLGVVGLWAAAYLVAFTAPSDPVTAVGKLLGALGSNEATKWLLKIYYVLVVLAALLFWSGPHILVLVAFIIGGYTLIATHEFLFGSGKKQREEEAVQHEISCCMQRERWREAWKLSEPLLKANPIYAETFAWYACMVGGETVPTLERLVNETLAGSIPDAACRGYLFPTLERLVNETPAGSFPGSACRGFLLFTRGVCHCHDGQIEEGRQCFSEAFGMMPEESARVTICEFVSNLVICARMPGLLAEADQYSELALQIKPKEITLSGTRGSILIEQGRIDEGTAMLDEVYSQTTSERDKAICAFYLALASRRRDHDEGVRVWRERMMQHGPPGWLLDRAGELERSDRPGGIGDLPVERKSPPGV